MWVKFSGGAIIATFFVLNLLHFSDSEDWLYTLGWLNRIFFPLVVAAGIYFAVICARAIVRSVHGNFYIAAIFCISAICAIIPFLSPDYFFLPWRWQYFLSSCWACAFILLGFSLFLVAARTNPLCASVLCVCGSLLLGLGAMETLLLFTNQYSDGLANLSAASSHAAHEPGIAEYENWSTAICGRQPATPGRICPSFHRLASFDRDLFDVKYGFNESGWRKLPDCKSDAKNDLLLFGCSFTFGLGLEDDETWAWRLARLLGPDWCLQNYGANGYSANHMLCMLENGLIPPLTARHRFALFLAIAHQARRNDLFPHTPHYYLNASGEPVAGGRQRLLWAFHLQSTFNGSQLARETGLVISDLAARAQADQVPLYLAIIGKSAQLLREKYSTKLIVLLWPDFEELAAPLKKMGIPVLLARLMLPDWNNSEDPGAFYRIDKRYDPHPNSRAATELATGLARYFRITSTEKGE